MDAAAQAISTHWLRHTLLTWAERHYGYAAATALAAMTGQPLALAIGGASEHAGRLTSWWTGPKP